MCEQGELLNSTASNNGKKISLDPEISGKPIRRKYSIEYKLCILQFLFINGGNNLTPCITSDLTAPTTPCKKIEGFDSQATS